MIAMPVHDQSEARLWETLARLFDPGEQITIDEWAQREVILPPDKTLFSGPLNLRRTPYMIGALRAIKSNYRRVALCWAAQMGKNTVYESAMAYIIDQDPGPMLIAMPSETFARRRSRKHLIPLIRLIPAVARHIAQRADALSNFEYIFDRMTINLAWAGSAASLASESIRWLIRDEIEKWKHNDKDESHPLQLSEMRVMAYDELARILDVSTPGLKSGAMCKALEEGTHHEYFVPCPHCGKPERMADVPVLVTYRTQADMRDELAAAGYQVLRHSGFTGHEDLTDKNEIRKRTVYRCEHCQKTFPHSAMKTIGQHGRWVPRRIGTNICSMQLPRWYRDLDSCSFGECEAEFQAAKGDPVALQGWINSYAAEGWEEMGAERSKDEIRSHCRGYAWQTIPFVPLYIVATVDIRATEIHMVIRAWTYHETSALLGHYLLPRLSKYDPARAPTGESLANLDPYLDKTFVDPDGEQYGISVTGIDSGWETDEVYEYCRSRPRCVAMKGEERMAMTLAVARPQKIWGTKDAAPDSCHLVSFQSGYFSDILNGRLNVSADAPGDWKLPSEVGDDYVKHMIAERKVLTTNKRTGRPEHVWKRFGNQPNHFRDCEKMQFVIARFLDIRSMQPPTGRAEAPPDQPEGFLGRDTSGFADRLRR